MSARTITQREFKQVKRLLRIAQEETRAVERTKGLIGNILPEHPAGNVLIQSSITNAESARSLVLRFGAKVKTK